MGKIIKKELSATNAAILWDIEETDFGDEDFDVPLIALYFATKPTSAGLVTLNYKVSGKVIGSVNPVGEDSVSFHNIKGIPAGTKLIVIYANPDTVSTTGDAAILPKRYN